MCEYIFMATIGEDYNIFYCTEDKNLYIEPNKKNKATQLLKIFGVLYTVGINFLTYYNAYFIEDYMEYIIVLSMLLGLAVGYLFSWYVSKEYEKIFSDVRPIRDVGREFIEQIAAIQNRFNIRLMLKKLVLAIFIVIMPLVAQYESTYEVMIVYPIAWMYFGLQCFYNNSIKRKKVLNEFKERYKIA